MNDKDKAILERYLNNISEFYAVVAQWLKDKSLSYEERDYQLNEKISGEYTAKILSVFSDCNASPLKNDMGSIAEIHPVGAWVIGASGRIDLIGDFDQQILVYLEKDFEKKTSETVLNDKGPLEISKNSYSPYKGVEHGGWYWIEDRRLGKAHAVNKELFFELLAEVTDYEF